MASLLAGKVERTVCFASDMLIGPFKNKSTGVSFAKECLGLTSKAPLNGNERTPRSYSEARIAGHGEL